LFSLTYKHPTIRRYQSKGDSFKQRVGRLTKPFTRFGTFKPIYLARPFLYLSVNHNNNILVLCVSSGCIFNPREKYHGTVAKDRSKQNKLKVHEWFSSPPLTLSINLYNPPFNFLSPNPSPRSLTVSTMSNSIHPLICLPSIPKPSNHPSDCFPTVDPLCLLFPRFASSHNFLLAHSNLTFPLFAFHLPAIQMFTYLPQFFLYLAFPRFFNPQSFLYLAFPGLSSIYQFFTTASLSDHRWYFRAEFSNAHALWV
jgi:hypothetical protein